MATKHLNIADTGTTGPGWQPSTSINDTLISKIKDRNAKTSNSLNAIPSPFSRLHVFETAFKLVTEDIREDLDRTANVYKELVSDCLDAIELLFNKKFHESQGDTLQIIKWKKELQLDSLKNSQFKEHITFAKTLEMYISQDFKENLEEITIIKYKGHVIAGTSPLTLLFTTPGLDKKDGVYRSSRLKNDFNLVNPYSGYRYFSKIIPFDKRSEAFKKYAIELFSESQILKDYCESVWNYVNEFSFPTDKDIHSSTEPIRTPTSGTLQILDVVLKQNKNDDALDIFNDHIIKVPYQINKDKFYTPSYINDEENRDFDFLLPIKSSFFSKINLQDIPRLITYEAKSDKQLTVIVKNLNNEKRPWVKTFIDGHVDKRDGEIIDYYKKFDLKLTLGIFPFLKVVDSNENMGKGNNTYNDYYKVLLGLYSTNEFLSNKNFDLKFFIINNSPELIEEVRTDDSLVNVKRYDRRRFEESSSTASVYYQLNNCCFDAIQLKLPNSNEISGPTGMIIPNWTKKVIKKKRFDFSVDFGTTNTFIAYTEDEDHSKKPKPFDITLQDMQMVMLNKPRQKLLGLSDSATFRGGNIAEIISDIVQHEFIPSLIINGEKDPFNVPFRTAVFEKKNLAESEYSLLDNINVHFAYQKALMISSEANGNQKFEPNLKWKISNDRISKERVNLFIEQILRMIKYKILLNGADPSLVNITWFVPQSLTVGALRDYEQLWEKHFSNILKSSGRLIKISESEAPFYYLKKGSEILDNQSVLTIDIGGGSTDVMLFASEKPYVGTSFNFAGNVFWGNGYNEFKDVKNNGIFKDLEKVVYDRIQNKSILPLHEELVKNSSTDEIINFWIANDADTEVVKELNSEKYRFTYLLHFTSIIYHCAQFIKSNKQLSPTCVIFSGNGSKYVDFIQTEEYISKIVGFIFRKMIDPYAKNPQIILPKADRKESTCYGGLYKDNKITPSTQTYLGTNLAFLALNEVKTYKQLVNTPSVFEDVVKNVQGFINMLMELNNEYNFKVHFNIDYQIEPLKRFLINQTSGNLNEGFSKRKSKIDLEDQITDSLFFYPIIGFIFQLNQLSKEKLAEFEPKEHFYTNCPDGPGVFLTHRLKAEKTFDAVYKITVSESNLEQAQITIIDETPVFRRAIGSIEEIINPVCKYDTYPISTDKAIQIIGPGLLVKKGNQWIVEEPIKIKFL